MRFYVPYERLNIHNIKKNVQEKKTYICETRSTSDNTNPYILYKSNRQKDGEKENQKRENKKKVRIGISLPRF